MAPPPDLPSRRANQNRSDGGAENERNALTGLKRARFATGMGLSAPSLSGGRPAAEPVRVVFQAGMLPSDEERVTGVDCEEAIPLGAEDVPEMLELVAQTEPGPFLRRTIELGDYLGIRRDGLLVAMAGERFHVDGWTEISAVCTKPDHRGQGLASRLVGALIASIRRRSERAFLHVMSTNTGAIRLYEELGFRVRQTATLTGVTREPLRGAQT